jgi:hypothetical protein
MGGTSQDEQDAVGAVPGANEVVALYQRQEKCSAKAILYERMMPKSSSDGTI